MTIRKLSAAAVLAALTAGAALPAAAGPLENMERERALLIETLLDPSLQPAQRQVKIEVAKRRLVDLERMTIRDDDLAEENTPTVRVAFRNYDLTFLVHASVERGVTVTDQWLDQLGVTSAALQDARVGRR